MFSAVFSDVVVLLLLLRVVHMSGCCLEEPMSFLPSAGKSFILGRVDEAVSNELGLGELAGLTVANEADNLAYEVSERRGDATVTTAFQVWACCPLLAAPVTAASSLRSATRTL